VCFVTGGGCLKLIGGGITGSESKLTVVVLEKKRDVLGHRMAVPAARFDGRTSATVDIMVRQIQFCTKMKNLSLQNFNPSK
jgi:hypothetical protein